MTYKVEFHTKAMQELKNLDGSFKLMVLKQIKKIMNNPEIGQLLGNKAGLDLTGYRKIYVNKKKIRIVYKLIENQLIIYIISIGTRDKGNVYEEANKRII